MYQQPFRLTLTYHPIINHAIQFRKTHHYLEIRHDQQVKPTEENSTDDIDAVAANLFEDEFTTRIDKDIPTSSSQNTTDYTSFKL